MMLKFLKHLIFRRPETDEERELRQKAHRTMLSSTAGLSGVGKIEEEEQDEDNKVRDNSGPKR